MKKFFFFGGVCLLLGGLYFGLGFPVVAGVAAILVAISRDQDAYPDWRSKYRPG